MKNLGQLSLSIAGLMMMTACTSNFDSNALKNHPLSAEKREVTSPDDIGPMKHEVREVPVEVKVPVEVYRNQPVEVQKNFMAAQLFQISNVTPVSFVAGSESQVKFEAVVLHGTSVFTVSAEQIPSGASFKEVSVEGNKRTYVLTYKPAANSLQGNAIEETKSLKLRLNLTSLVHQDKDKEAQLKQAFSNVDRSKSFDVVVRRDRSNPKIDKIEIPDVVAEGEARAVAIHVTAPGTYEGFAPRMIREYGFDGFNGGMLENNGATFLKPSSSRKAVEFVSEGKWIFNFDIDAKTAALIPPQLNSSLAVVATDTVLFRANLMVLSPTGATSDERTIKYKISVKRGAQ